MPCGGVDTPATGAEAGTGVWYGGNELLPVCAAELDGAGDDDEAGCGICGASGARGFEVVAAGARGASLGGGIVPVARGDELCVAGAEI